MPALHRLQLVLCSLLLLTLLTHVQAQQAPFFSKLIVFGDSLSDVGNVSRRSVTRFGIQYPSPLFNYTTGRFTNGLDTAPPARFYTGVWHEQHARTFLNRPVATPSLEGGTDYAFGG